MPSLLALHTHTGMLRCRALMPVFAATLRFAQFDILWDGLTAIEHLSLFAAIKGIPAAAATFEAQRRIEEVLSYAALLCVPAGSLYPVASQVRLTEAAGRPAGAFSGGMRRRLSVAVALIGEACVKR